jgi:hypothetical protein
MGKRATHSTEKYISSGGGRRAVRSSANSEETIQQRHIHQTINFGTIAGDYQDTQPGKQATHSTEKYISSGGEDMQFVRQQTVKEQFSNRQRREYTTISEVNQVNISFINVDADERRHNRDTWEEDDGSHTKRNKNK